MQSIIEYFHAHPEMLAVVWPIVTALLSLVQGAIRARFPRVAAFLSAAGLDLVALARAAQKPAALSADRAPVDPPKPEAAK